METRLYPVLAAQTFIQGIRNSAKAALDTSLKTGVDKAKQMFLFELMFYREAFTRCTYPPCFQIIIFIISDATGKNLNKLRLLR